MYLIFKIIVVYRIFLVNCNNGETHTIAATDNLILMSEQHNLRFVVESHEIVWERIWKEIYCCTEISLWFQDEIWKTGIT